MPECFVIMGFGTKQDPDTGRALNLDSTYEFIIKPAVEAAGYECIRADEIQHSGVIDKPMYEKLLRADLVVADITTANANAIYELGVRHALRPQATIVIKEQDGKRYFDLNHLATISYKHLGEEIGAGEARNKAKQLQELIEEKRRAPKDDSPVYEFLHGLSHPILAAPGGRRGVPMAPPPAPEPQGPSLAKLREAANAALKAGDYVSARERLKQILESGFQDPAVLQKLALSTYKSDDLDRKEALVQARAIIEQLAPMSSTDPETLGIAGAIRKRQWLGSKDPTALDDAISLYGRGWSVREDYYTGENYASCLEMRADATADPEQAAMDRMSALRVRRQLAAYLSTLVAQSATKKRDDYKWMLATLSNTQLALGDEANALENEQAFRNANPTPGEIEAFEATKALMPAQAQKYQELRRTMGLGA